jgi:TetR/AcrR family transcriptional regulator, transcriptional repressor for nem operon
MKESLSALIICSRTYYQLTHNAAREKTVMPYAATHKAQTRQRIVDAARKLFNRHGFEQVSIDRIMADAGLTRGGFYNHFQSKDELYAAAVASFITCNPFSESIKDRPPDDPVLLARMLVDLYLSDEILEDLDLHCPLYALPCDVARAGLSPQKAYTDLIRGMTQVYRQALEHLPDSSERAQVIVSLCVGGMVLARTTDDEAMRRSLRTSARKQALALLEGA